MHKTQNCWIYSTGINLSEWTKCLICLKDHWIKSNNIVISHVVWLSYFFFNQNIGIDWYILIITNYFILLYFFFILWFTFFLPLLCYLYTISVLNFYVDLLWILKHKHFSCFLLHISQIHSNAFIISFLLAAPHSPLRYMFG